MRLDFGIIQCGQPWGPNRMDSAKRDWFLQLADQIAADAGGLLSLDQALEQANAIVAQLHELLEKVKTRDLLIQALDQTELPEHLERLLLAALAHMPELLRHWAVQASEFAVQTLPAPTERRPTVPAQAQLEIIRYIEHLYVEKQVPLHVAKQRAVEKFGWALRTVNRYWSRRGEILEAGPTLRLSDVIAGLKEQWQTDRKSGEPLI